MWHDKKEYFRQSDGEFPGYRRGTGLIPRIVFLLFLFLALAVGESGQALSDGTVSLTPQERQWLSQHDGQVRIGITVIPPQIIRDNVGYQGLSIDYIRLMERKLGCRFKLVPFATWNEVIQAAKMRRIDTIFAAQKTPDRLAYLLFTEPYIELPNMIVVRKDRQGAYSLKEMKGWSVAVSEGSAVQEYLLKEFAYLDLRPVHDELTGLMKVSLGEVDAMVVEISRASYYIEKAGILNLRVAGNAGLLYQLRFAVRNDWPVLSGILDKGLSSITGEERREISRRWIIVGEKSIFATRAFRISLVAVAGGIALTVIVVVVWNRTLRRTVRQRTSQLQQELAERKRAEEELRRLTLFQRTILDNAAYGIISASPDGIVSSFNPAAERLLGYTADEVVGKQTPACWHDPEEMARRALRLSGELGETIPPGFEVFVARARSGPPDENEWTFIRKDGTRVPVLLSVTALRDESGRITGFVGLTYDLTERKQAEEALLEGEALLNTLLNAIPIPVFYKDRDGRYLGFNRAYETFFGATRDQLIGKTVFNISPRELAESYRAKDSELFESGGVQQYESQVKNTHGVLRDVIFNKAVYTDSQGTNIGLIGAILDITELKQAEEALRESEEKYRTIFQNSPLGIFRSSFEGRFLDVNPATAKILGYDSPEAVIREIYNIAEQIYVRTGDRQRIVSEQLGSADITHYVNRFRRKDGSEFIANLYLKTIHDTEGRPIYLQGIVEDITEHKRAERDIALMNFALNNVHEAAFLIDENAHFNYVNEYVCRALGYSRDELLGLGVPDVDPDFPAELWPSHWVDLKTQGSLTFEGRHRAKDGGIIPVEISANYFEYDGKGYNLALARGITGRKLAEEERLTHLRFFESMDRVNRAIQETNDLEQMMSDVLDVVLSIFGCDRAYLMHPCDPEAESWVIPMERTTPEYPGSKVLGVDLSKDAGVAGKLRLLLSSDGPVNMGPGTPYMLSGTTAEQFSISSMMAMAVYPKVGKPWEFGIHQCSYNRVWNPEEERLLKEIGRRLADALTSLLSHRDLLESEAKYRLIVDTAIEGICSLGPDTMITFVNARMAEMLGYAGPEVIGRPFTDFMFEEDAPDHLRKMENRRRGLSENYERRFRRKDGETVWTQASATPILDDEHRFKGSFAMFTDITERRRAETKVKEQLYFLQQLLDSMPIPVYYKDVDGVYLGCNAPFETLVGMPRSEIVRKTAYEVLPKERADIHHEADLALLRHPGIQTYEVGGIYKDGKHHDAIFNKATFVDADNRVAGIVGAQIDITERKQMEEELRRLNEELEQRVEARTNDLEAKRAELEESQGALMNIVEDLNEKSGELEQANSRLKELDRLKSMFIASMSHELRTPLNSVIGFSSVLLNEWVGPINAEQKENLAIILRSGKHLLNLINDVIDVSKIEAGKIESVQEEFDLHDLVYEAVSLVKEEFGEKGLDLRVAAAHQQMRTDRRRLLQCVLNLLSNAVKFTEQGGVTVETQIVQSPGTTPAAGVAEISVTDTGIGIREEDIGKMFQPFVRLSSPLQATVPGTGLGLYLTRKLAAEVLKGDILLTSEYGKGSRFTIRIPLVAP
jgi:PAS domain S-box-containing protein